MQVFVLVVCLEYPEDLRELHNDCLLTPDKLEIKEKNLSKYQLMVADLFNVRIGNVDIFFGKY